MSARPYICVDIESIPMPGCDAYLTDDIEAPANYKHPAKIAAFIAEKRAAEIDRAGLDLDLCEVAAIAICGGDEGLCLTREVMDERKLLEWFWRMARDKTIVGFNCVAFDLPILLRRSLYLSVMTPDIHVDKYRHDGVIDVAEVLSYQWRTPWRSLEFYCRRFGLPYDDSVKGQDIARLAAEGEWKAISAHASSDATATMALALRAGLIYAPEISGVL